MSQVFLLHYAVQVQVPENYKVLIQRYGHGAGAVIVYSDYVEMILFGGKRTIGGSFLADPEVLKFGECIRVLSLKVIRTTVDYILLI